MRRALCAAAIALVWLVVIGWQAGMRWNTPWSAPHALSLPANGFRVVLGAAVEDGTHLRVGAVGNDGNALQARHLDGVRAADWPFLRYKFEDFPRTLELSLVFRRADAPDNVQAITVPWPGNGWQTVDLRRLPAWHGEIIEIGFAEFATAQLVPPSEAFVPFAFDRAELVGASWQAGINALSTAWFAYVPWALHSVSALVPDRATLGTASPVPALVAGLVLSLVVAALVLRWSRRRALCAAGIAAALGWVVLDAHWLRDFHARHALTEHLYAGKSWDERKQLQPDQDLSFMAGQVGDWLDAQPQPQRLLVAADSNYVFLRLIYLLLPHNAALLQLTGGAALPADSLLVLYQSTLWHYDAAQRAIIGANRDYPADPVFETGTLRVYRLRGAGQ